MKEQKELVVYIKSIAPNGQHVGAAMPIPAGWCFELAFSKDEQEPCPPVSITIKSNKLIFKPL